MQDNAPGTHRELEARAAEAGMSLPEYLLRDLEARADLIVLGGSPSARYPSGSSSTSTPSAR